MQEVLTYIVILAAVSVAVYKIYLAIPFKTKKTSPGKCGSCSTGCALKNLNVDPECPTEKNVTFILK